MTLDQAMRSLQLMRTEVMPKIESEYHVANDRNSRAIAGGMFVRTSVCRT